MPKKTTSKTKTKSAPAAKWSCKKCRARNELTAAFCRKCGAPHEDPAAVVDPTEAASPVPVAPAIEPEKNPQQLKALKSARTTLLVVAVIQIVVGLVLGLVLQNEKIFAVGVVLVGVIFLGLWFWAKKNPFPAAIAGLVAFITLHLAEAIIDPTSIPKGIIMKILVISFLIKGIKAGMEYRKVQKVVEDAQTTHP